MPEFGSLSSDEALADGDIKLTNSVITFARHLAVGRIAPTRVSAEVDYGNHTPEPADILRKIADARDLDAGLDSFNPPHDGFKALKGKLAELRSNASAPRAEADDRIPDGQRINPGDKDARVPALRNVSASRARLTTSSTTARCSTRSRMCRPVPTSSRPASSTARRSTPSTARSRSSRPSSSSA